VHGTAGIPCCDAQYCYHCTTGRVCTGCVTRRAGRGPNAAKEKGAQVPPPKEQGARRKSIGTGSARQEHVPYDMGVVAPPNKDSIFGDSDMSKDFHAPTRTSRAHVRGPTRPIAS